MIDGTHLKKLCQEYGYALTDLAREINVSESTIKRWERNNSLSNYQDIKILADLYHVSVKDIMGEAWEEFVNSSEPLDITSSNEEIASESAIAVDEPSLQKSSTQIKFLPILKTGIITAGCLMIFYVLVFLTIFGIILPNQQPRGVAEASAIVVSSDLEVIAFFVVSLSVAAMIAMLIHWLILFTSRKLIPWFILFISRKRRKS